MNPPNGQYSSGYSPMPVSPRKPSIIKRVLFVALMVLLMTIANVCGYNTGRQSILRQLNDAPQSTSEYSSRLPSVSSQPSSSSADSSAENVKCDQLQLAEDVLQSMLDAMYEQYDERYFVDNPTFVDDFVKGYWQGVWNQHKYCKICIANGDVPPEYALPAV